MLCGVYIGATRLVHGHHEKIAARPCKESHTAEDGRKHGFRDFRGFVGYFEELVCARITRYSRSVFFVDLGVTQAILTNNKFLFYFIDATFFFWSHTGVCSVSGRRFYALYTEIWHQDWLRVGCANSIRILHLYYACIQAGACNLIVYGIDGLSLPPPTAPRPNHRTPGTSTLL